jgi:hypothetical protein
MNQIQLTLTGSFFKRRKLYQTYTNDHANRGTQKSIANQIKQERIEIVWGRHYCYESTQLHDYSK